MRPVPQRAVGFVRMHEGCRLDAYQDSALVWTIGYGHTGKEVHPSLRISQRQADIYLKEDLSDAAARLAGVVKPEVIAALSEGQYAALLSFVFNLGANRSWTIWKRLNARALDDVPVQMARFVHAGGRKLKGLVNRRAAEIALWHEDAEDEAPPSSFVRVEETPPTPAPSPPMQKTSLMMKAGAGVGLVGAAADQVREVVTPHAATVPLFAQDPGPRDPGLGGLLDRRAVRAFQAQRGGQVMIPALAVLRQPLARYALIGLGVLLIVAAWRIDHAAQARRLVRADAALAAARADLTQSRANVASLKTAVAAQNAAVSRLESDARARQAKAQAEVRNARKGREAAEARAGRILAAQARGDRCLAADKLILESLR